MKYAYEIELIDENGEVEIPLTEIVQAMSKEDVKKITAIGVEYYCFSKKKEQGFTIEQCQWQAFAEYICDLYGVATETDLN